MNFIILIISNIYFTIHVGKINFLITKFLNYYINYQSLLIFKIIIILTNTEIQKNKEFLDMLLFCILK